MIKLTILCAVACSFIVAGAMMLLVRSARGVPGVERPRWPRRLAISLVTCGVLTLTVFGFGYPPSVQEATARMIHHCDIRGIDYRELEGPIIDMQSDVTFFTWSDRTGPEQRDYLVYKAWHGRWGLAIDDLK